MAATVFRKVALVGFGEGSGAPSHPRAPAMGSSHATPS